MQILRRGSEGDEVRRWQSFLVGQDILRGPVDGVFGPVTEEATRKFQRRTKVEIDGCVGPRTYAAALQRGFDPGFTDPQGGTSGTEWPPRPVFGALAPPDCERLFGRFAFERTSPHKDEVRIRDDWEAKNLVRVTIPQLRGVKGAPASGRVALHRRVADQTRALFAAWEQAGMQRLLLSFGSTFDPRFIRGSHTLSNHSWAIAFDLNGEWNPLGTLPALRGRKGSVRELVPLANEYGYFWGGHFLGRADGMHFEVARPLG